MEKLLEHHRENVCDIASRISKMRCAPSNNDLRENVEYLRKFLDQAGIYTEECSYCHFIGKLDHFVYKKCDGCGDEDALAGCKENECLNSFYFRALDKYYCWDCMQNIQKKRKRPYLSAEQISEIKKRKKELEDDSDTSCSSDYDTTTITSDDEDENES